MGTRDVQLASGYVVSVDAEDYERLSEHNWSYDGGYARRSVRVAGKRQLVHMHRVIMSAPEGYHVDHINGDKLDNRRCNLRLATHAQNLCNRGANKNNTSGFKGVSFFKLAGRFRAYIKVSGENKHLGYYTDKEEAARAYDKAALKFHGEYARLNFPSPTLVN